MTYRYAIKEYLNLVYKTKIGYDKLDAIAKNYFAEPHDYQKEVEELWIQLSQTAKDDQDNYGRSQGVPSRE